MLCGNSVKLPKLSTKFALFTEYKSGSQSLDASGLSGAICSMVWSHLPRFEAQERNQSRHAALVEPAGSATSAGDS